MKKTLFASVLFCAAVFLPAQEGAGSRLLNVRTYISNLGVSRREDGRARVPVKYEDPLSDEEYYSVAKLGGSPEGIDTDYEALLATYYFQKVASIRPPEAVRELPANNRTSELRMGAAAYMDMQVAKFTGSDAAPYAAALKFITGRGNVTEAEIKRFMAQGIAAEVDAQFNQVSFLLDKTAQVSYNAVLTRTSNNQYILSYERPSVENDDKELTAPTLQALLDTMRRNTADFSQTSIDQVRAQAALIPAVVFDGWRNSTRNMVSPYELLTKALTDFYTTPNRANYEVICGIQARAMLAVMADGDAFTEAMDDSIGKTIASLSERLYERVTKDLISDGAVMAAVNKPNDPRYGIFTLTKTTGDEIFVSKKVPATGLVTQG